MMTEPLKGRCLCGAVTFTATPQAMQMSVCHCEMCRRWSGGTFMAVECGSSVRFAEGSPTGSYKGSPWGERIFCRECGSTLVWQMQSGEHQNVAVQAFDDPSMFKFTSQIFIDRKPGNYDFANQTAMMTEAEVMAMYAPPSKDTDHA